MAWLVVVGGFCMLFACGRAPQAPGGEARLAPPGRGPAIPLPEGGPASASASPAPYERVPFTFGPDERLGLYDRASADLQVFPGAGTGLENAFEYAPFQIYFDDRQDVFLLDVVTEERIKLVDGHEVGGFAFSPAFDGQQNLYFLGTQRPDLADAFAYAKFARAEATASPPPPLGPYLGKPVFLSPINALAGHHGGVTSLNVTGSGEVVVFTTGDGGLYVYYPRSHEVQPLLADLAIADRGAAAATNIDPIWGRFVVWQDSARKGIFLFDRWRGLVDAAPLPNLAPAGAVAVSAPNFYGSDPYHVIFTATFAPEKTRLFAYDIVTERLVALVWLNAFRLDP